MDFLASYKKAHMNTFQDGSCYMFDCGTPDDFYCRFDPNEGYVSGALEIDRHLFEDQARGHQVRS